MRVETPTREDIDWAVRAIAADEERAAIVAWLRQTSAKLKAVAPGKGHVMRVGDESDLMADAIERGDHLK